MDLGPLCYRSPFVWDEVHIINPVCATYSFVTIDLLNRKSRKKEKHSNVSLVYTP